MGGRPKIRHGSQNNLTGNSRLNVRYTYTETLREPGGQVRNDTAVRSLSLLCQIEFLLQGISTDTSLSNVNVAEHTVLFTFENEISVSTSKI